MKDRLLQFPDIEHGKESMISMILTQSILLGIFYGAFDISAHSLFLSLFDEKALAKAYAVSGFTGVVLTALYSWLHRKFKFRNFAAGNLLFITILTIILWIALVLLPSDPVVFTVLVMMGPLNILALLSFRETTCRLLTPQQVRRIPGLIDSAIITGVIIISFSIPLLLLFELRSRNLLQIAIAAILFATVLQIIIGKKFHFTADDSGNGGTILKFTLFKNDSFIRIAGLFVALSILAAFFIQYSFMAVTREQYPEEVDMARFLGLFTGSVMMIVLLLKTVLFSYLIKNYGTKACLSISPLILAGITAVAVITGMLSGYTPASTGGFIIFFIMLAFSRLFSKLLRDSVESPSFKVICQPVEQKTRYELQSGMNGIFNEIAVLSSGLLLAGLGALSFVKLIHFTWVLLAVIILWIYVARKLFTEYRKSIRKSIETHTGQKTRTGPVFKWGTLKNRISGLALFKSSFFKLVTGDLSVIENSENRWLHREIINYAEVKQDLNMLPGLKKIAAKPYIDEDLRHRSVEVIDQLEETKGDPRKLKKSIPLAAADDNLINARRNLASSRLPQTTEILRLLRNNNIESRRYAIYMIGKFRLLDMIPEVCNCLGIPDLEMDAMNILDSFGPEAAKELYRLYLNSSGNVRISKLIIRLLSKSNTKENTDFLFARLWSNSRQVKEAAVQSLIGRGFIANPEEKNKLHQLISDTIGLITWNISAQSCLDNYDDSVLIEIIRKETASWTTFLFNILSIAYDPGSVSWIKTNLEAGTSENVSYALEMVDTLIDKTVRAQIIALIDSVSDEEKLKNLHQFYPGETVYYEQLVEDIINRDYNLISIWAKACTLRNMKNINGKNTEESVIALLFSPENIIQEETANLISRTKKEVFYTVSSRLPKDLLEIPEMIIRGDRNNNEFLIEKVRFLSGIFKDIPEDELLYPAGSLKYIKDVATADFSPDQSYIIWNISSDLSETRVFTLTGDNVIEFKDKFMITGDAFFYLLPSGVLEYFQSIYPEQSFEIYNYLESAQFNT